MVVVADGTECESAYLRLVALLEARFGLGPGFVDDRLRGFLAGRAEPARAASLAMAAEDHPDWPALVEALLVHETYFYRHPDQLSVLANEILPRLMATIPGGRRLNVWCAGCATGEEPYTLAALLRDAACPAGILATDLSAESVAVTRAGQYRHGPGLNSFRALPPAAWRHFEPTPGIAECWSVAPALRRMVDATVHNLMTPPPPGYSADVICCRNVLLYFTAAGLRRAEESLVAAARPGTVLVLGPAERLRYTTVFVPMTRSNTQILHWPLSGAR